MTRIFFATMIFVFGVGVQSMVQGLLPLPWSAVSLPLCLLPTLVHFGILHAQREMLPIWYGVAGMLLEITSPYPFGGFTIMCVVSTFAVQWIFEEFITTVSLLSYIFLLVFSIGIYYFVQLLFLLATGVLASASDIIYFITTHGNVIIASMVLSLCSYVFAHFVGRRLMHTHA